MSELEFIAQTARRVSEVSFEDFVNYGKVFAVAVGIGLALYYVPKWREKWYQRDEEKKNQKKDGFVVLSGK